MDKAQAVSVAANKYFRLLRKVNYGCQYFLNKDNLDNDMAVQFTVVLRNLSVAYKNLKKTGFAIPDINNFQGKGFDVIDGLLYGDMAAAKQFADANMAIDNPNYGLAIYIQHALAKEERTFVEYPEDCSNCSKTVKTPGEDSKKSVSLNHDVFTIFNNLRRING